MQPRVFIIILNWNGKETTRECILSVKEIDYENYDIVVVDNASMDDSVKYLKESFLGLEIITNNKNLGYAGGNNVGIRYVQEKGCDFVLLLNNDVVVNRDFLGKLVDTANGDGAIGIVGPLIYYYKTKIINFAGAYLGKEMFTPIIRGYRQYDTGKFNRVEGVDYVSGACILIKSHLFKDIGLLDEDYFALWDETDFCHRAKNAGYKVIFQPHSIIWHKESESFKQIAPEIYNYYYIRNRLLFLKKNIKNSTMYRFCIAFRYIIDVLILLKNFRNPANCREAKANFLAILDFYCGKYGKRY